MFESYIRQIATIGARSQKVGSIHGGIIGGQVPKNGFHSWGHYWGPVDKMWGPFVGALLGARDQKVGSIHRGIIRGQGPKCGIHSLHKIHLWGPYWGPGAEKWDQFMGALLGARG